MMISGTGVSPGVIIGNALVIKKQASTLTGIVIPGDDVAAEIEKFDAAVNLSIADVNILINGDGTANKDGRDILESHIELLSDPQIKEDVIEQISTENRNVNDAVIIVINNAVAMFQSMEDDYLRARAIDVQDIGDRILGHLNTNAPVHKVYQPNTIIIADDLTPSDTIGLDTNFVIGFATAVGGKTSHTAIVAKSLTIPAIVGCGELLMAIQDNDMLILDGEAGVVIVNPNVETIQEYKTKRDIWLANVGILRSLKDKPAITTDNTAIKLLANIADAADMTQAIEFGAQGCGLLRTEILFMGRDSMPTEDEQFEFYKSVVIKAKGAPVIVRTLDIGGDKQLPYFNIPAEQNPFLGYRAIRISLDRVDIFTTQLRAILRASAFGKLKIMFPMISGIQEIRAAKIILNEAIEALAHENISFDKTIEVGIMIEIPSAAIIADLLAKEVDFFSIGTNDLCQYTLAVDRMNEKIKDLYDPYDPSVLRLIANVIEQAHKNNIEAGMCGELASDPNATLLLLGMGLREFSMSSASIPQVKNIIINNSISKAKQVYEQVMTMDNAKTISSYLKEVNQ